MRAGTRCATLAWGAGFALACHDEERVVYAPPQPIPGCESYSYEACDILTDTCQRELFGLVACLRGEAEPGEPPSVRLLGEQEVVSLIAGDEDVGPGVMSSTDGVAEMMRSAGDERAFQAQVRGLELLGLLEPGLVQDDEDVVDLMVSSVVAYYVVARGEIVIIDRGEQNDTIEANGVLAHEFVHVLQDRRYGLATFGANIGLTSDGSLAISSLVEGEASLYQDLFRLAAQGAPIERFDLAAFYADVAGFGTRQTLAATSPVLTAASIFPYTHGARYAGDRWLRGGATEVDALFSEPPSTTLQVLGGSGPIAPLEVAPAPLDGYELLGADAAGAWISAAMLVALPGNDGAVPLVPLARRWRGDRFWVYATADEPPAVAAAWAIDWSDAEAATTFAQRASVLAPAGGVVALETTGRSTRLCAAERADDLAAWCARLAEAAPPAP